MSYQLPGQPPQGASDQELDAYLEQLLGGDLPGEGFLNPDDPGENDPRPVPTPDVVRDELLRASRTMAIALQLPYSEEKKADLGHAMLAAAQAYLLLDPTLDAEGVQQIGEGSAPEHAAEVAQKFPAPTAEGGEAAKRKTVNHPRVQPNSAEKRLDTRTKSMQADIKGARGQAPRPRPRAGG